MDRGLAADILDLARALVRAPSRAAVDAPEPVADVVEAWTQARGLTTERLRDDDGAFVGLVLHVEGLRPGRRLCLNACLDTAPFGDPARWSYDPLSAELAEGYLWGRGAADSKMGAAIILHLAERLQAKPPKQGSLSILLDTDEHSGVFGGIQAYLGAAPRPDAVVLGYPGHDSLLIGGRGFLRCRLLVRGDSAHSGSSRKSGLNAISKAADLIRAFDATPPEADDAGSFVFGPAATVTAVEGGEGFSQVPDKVACNLDIRLTPTFGRDAALVWLTEVVKRVDVPWGGPATGVEVVDHWPAYELDPSNDIVEAFRRAGRAVLGRDVPTRVSGPSNIGNLLSAHGIPTLCALGVGYRNLHAADERACVADIEPVFRMYDQAARLFWDGPATKAST